MTQDEETEERLFGTVRKMAALAGGQFHNLSNNVVVHLPNGHRRLVVTFDNLAGRRETEDRLPWGQAFLEREGWDILGVLSKQADWFRQIDLKDLFQRLRDEGLFQRYEEVVFYGASMGAFGALAFASVAPGCRVVAMAPQSTLNRQLVPFEQRYRYGRGLGDWEEPRFRDGVDGVAAAKQVYVFYDPQEPLDTLHAKRLMAQNVVLMPVSGAGHKIPPLLQQLGILKPVALGALDGTLTTAEFARLYRARRKSVRLIEGILVRAEKKGHLKLALRAVESVLAETPHWRLRHKARALRQAQRR